MYQFDTKFFMKFIQSDDRANECQKLLHTTQVLFCIFKTILHLNIKSHTKLCLSTLYKVVPLQFQWHKIRPSKRKEGGWWWLDYSIQFPSTSEDTTQEVLHHTFLIPNPHKLQTAWQTLLHRENSMQQQTREEQWCRRGGGERNASETVIEIRIAARMHNATAKPLHAFGVPEACQQEIRGHRFHQEDFDRIQKRDQGSNEEYVDATPEAGYA